MTDPNTDTVKLTFEFETPLTAETLEAEFRELADRMADVQNDKQPLHALGDVTECDSYPDSEH